MKKNKIVFVFFMFCMAGCKEKTKKNQEPVISAASIIKGQLRHLDTSFYQIVKYETDDSATDTVYLKREDVKKYAKPFMEIPDISEKSLLEKYTEEKIIDRAQNTLSITYTAKDEKPAIQKEIIIVNLDNLVNGKVESIYIDRFIPAKESSVEQHLFWQIDKFFQIGNIVQQENKPEKISTLKIIWQ